MEWFGEIWQWLLQFWESLTWGRIVWGLTFTVVTIIASYALIVIGMIKIPADYFSSQYVKKNSAGQTFFRSLGRVDCKKYDWFSS